MGNHNLKPANQKIGFTMEQAIEYAKCAADPVYFVEKYIKIVNVDKGLILFPLYPFQKDIIMSLHNNRNTICKLPRQVGKTTTTAAYAIHQIIFREKYSILIAANKASTAYEIMKRIREAYQYVPKWLQQGVTKWNAGSVEFENGSRIMATATTGDAARGFSHNFIILDEFAFLPQNIADNFFTSVLPTISSGETTKMAILSTPKGTNHFYDLWMGAKETKERVAKGELQSEETHYMPIEIKWSDVPGRDEAFKTKMINLWSGDVNRWMQEYETEFIGSSNTLISPMALQDMDRHRKPIGTTPDGLVVYKTPEKGHTYFVTVDTAEGKELDYHAITVFDVTNKPFEVVARFRNNKLQTILVADVVYQIGITYNTAYVLIETRSLGVQVASQLFNELEYPNILGATNKVGRGGNATLGPYNRKAQGFSTSVTTKQIGCNRLKILIESNQLIPVDKDIIAELKSFVLVGNTYQAEDGKYDDLAMTLVIFSWASSTEFFKELTDVNIKDQFNDKVAEMEEAMLPFGYIVDSTEDHIIYMPQGIMEF